MFICLFAIIIPSLMKCLQLFSHFSNWLSYNYLVVRVFFLNIFWIKVLCQICDLQIVSSRPCFLFFGFFVCFVHVCSIYF